MLITFSKHYLTSPSHRDIVATVIETGDEVSRQKYGCNVYPQTTWATPRRVRFTLETRDAWAHGSRTSASGRHMRKASWEAHRDVLVALFDVDPDATIKTALATYYGRKDFHDKFPSTGGKNIGSQVQPITMPECSI